MGKPSAENFYKRLNTLAGTNKSKINEQNKDYGTLIDFQKSNEGTVYGIVKENHLYYIKKSNAQNSKMDASDFAYIGGLENKHNYEYHSLGEAEKQRNFYIKSLNEAFSLAPKKESVNEVKEETIDNPFSFIHNRIHEGKIQKKSNFETKFKSSLNENISDTNKKNGLMPEAANIAVKKALGILSEEKAISTEDSEIKEKDEVANMKGKEKPQAPINDSNAKTIADKAMGKDSQDYPKVPKSGKSIAVNQEDNVLKEEVSPLVTADSEENPADSLANKTGEKHEPSQAPINDTNAKAIADKATGGQGGAPLPNDTEESDESEPFDDKEDNGEKPDEISVNVAEGVVNEKWGKEAKMDKSEKGKYDGKTQAELEKMLSNVKKSGPHKKGSPEYERQNELEFALRAKHNFGKVSEGKAEDMDNDGDIDSDDWKAKRDQAIKKNKVSEGEEKDIKKGVPFDDKLKNVSDLSTEDSEEVPSDSVAQSKKVTTKPDAAYNNYNQPDKGQKDEKGAELKNIKEKGQISVNIAEGDKKVKPFDGDVKKVKALSTEDSKEVPSDSIANKTTASSKKTNKSLSTEDSEENPADSVANKTKTKLPNPVAEAIEALTTMDSEENPADSVANKIHEDDNIDNELDDAAAALNDLESAEAEPEVPAEPPAEPMPDMGGEAPAPDAELPTADEPIPDMGGEPPAPDAEVPAPEGEPAPEEGEVQADDETKNEVKSLAGEIGELVRGKKFTNDDIVEIVNQLIEPFDTETLSHNEKLKIQNKLNGSEGAGEDLPPEAPAPEGGDVNGAIDAQIDSLGGEAPVGEGEEMCAECGTFENYAKSRGYDDLNECPAMELANLISGYANAHGEGMNDGDFQGIAILLTPEVKDELAGYGHDDFIAQAEPFAAEAGMADTPGVVDVEVPADIEAGEEEEIEDDKKKSSDDVEEGMYDEIDMETVDQGIGVPHPEDVEEAEQLDELGWRDIKNLGAGLAGVGQKTGEKIGQKVGQAQQAVANKMQQGVDYVADKAKGVKQTYHKGVANRIVNDINQDATKLGQTIAKFNAQAEKAGQQPISPQSIIMKMMGQLKQGGQTGFQHRFEGLGEGGEDFASMASDVDMETDARPLKSDDDLKQATFAPLGQNLGVGMHTGAMSESEKKIRNYVVKRLEEMTGKRKATMNESSKPDVLKKLDQKIAEQWDLYQKQINNGKK